jgi:hypothetical protein
MSNETATFLEFASRFGWKQSYVTQLKKDGRLALTGDGKAIRVAESLALIETTRDPSRAGVAARHAQARTKAAADAQDAPPAAHEPGEAVEESVEPTEAKDSGARRPSALNATTPSQTASCSIATKPFGRWCLPLPGFAST